MAQVTTLPAVAGSAASASGFSNSQTDRAFNQSVAASVRALNEIGIAGQGREVTFSVDPQSHRPVVKVVDTDTKQVVQQWPAEYALQLAADYANQQRDSR